MLSRPFSQTLVAITKECSMTQQHFQQSRIQQYRLSVILPLVAILLSIDQKITVV